MPLDLDQLLIDLGQRNGSDLHLKVGRPPLYRINGELNAQQNYPVVTDDDIRDCFFTLLGPDRMSEFERTLESDFSYEIPGFARFRINAFVQRGHIGSVMRLIPLDVPSIDQIGLPDVLKEIIRQPNGLIIVTGPTGSGKSTTLAAMINEVNITFSKHIITIEDPIEFVYEDRKCTINQRELGLDTFALSHALRAALRQDPDVILMGEMRDSETIQFGITAAETGHLVFSTLHTNDAKQSIDRILDTFDGAEANMIRLQLALTLRAVISQRLIKRADGRGRVAALEVLINTPHVKQIIEEGGTSDLEKALMEGAHHKMQNFNQSLYKLFQSSLISEESAILASTQPEDLKLMMRGISRGASADELAEQQKAQAQRRQQYGLGGGGGGGGGGGADAGGDKKKGRGFNF